MEIKTARDLVRAMESIAFALKYLGTGDNGSTMGAVEFHGVCVKEAGDALVTAVGPVAEALTQIGYAGEKIADAISEVSDSLDGIAQAIPDPQANHEVSSHVAHAWSEYVKHRHELDPAERKLFLQTMTMAITTAVVLPDPNDEADAGLPPLPDGGTGHQGGERS